MPHWHMVATVADCPPGSSHELVVGDRIVALFNVEGTFYAIDGICPHQGGPLGEGQLTGCLVTCPWHGWQFDVTTGRYRANPRLAVECFAVRVEEGQIWVELPGA